MYMKDLAIVAFVLLTELAVGRRIYLLIQEAVFYLAGILGRWLLRSASVCRHLLVAGGREGPLPGGPAGQFILPTAPRVAVVQREYWVPSYSPSAPPHSPYFLEQRYKDIPALQEVEPLTIGASLRSLHLNLWDEKVGRRIGFCELSRVRQQAYVLPGGSASEAFPDLP